MPSATHSPILLRSTARLRSSILVAQLAVFLIQSLSLLLQILKVTVFLLELLLQVANFRRSTGLFELSSVFTLSFSVTFVLLDFGFQFEGFEDLEKWKG